MGQQAQTQRRDFIKEFMDRPAADRARVNEELWQRADGYEARGMCAWMDPWVKDSKESWQVCQG